VKNKNYDSLGEMGQGRMEINHEQINGRVSCRRKACSKQEQIILDNKQWPRLVGGIFLFLLLFAIGLYARKGLKIGITSTPQ
jgi:hypothetical protein